MSRKNGNKLLPDKNNILTGTNKIKNISMLLEICLSNSVSNNPRMVKNVRKCKNKDILSRQIGDSNPFSTMQVYTHFHFDFTTTHTPYESYYSSRT